MDIPDIFQLKRISNAILASDDSIVLSFEGTNKKIKIWDDGQDCCEKRYLTLDDDLNCLIGGILLAVREGIHDGLDDTLECHEIMFVTIESSKGSVTFCNHNEHNGYYGGFNVTLKTIQ